MLGISRGRNKDIFSRSRKMELSWVHLAVPELPVYCADNINATICSDISGENVALAWRRISGGITKNDKERLFNGKQETLIQG